MFHEDEKKIVRYFESDEIPDHLLQEMMVITDKFLIYLDDIFDNCSCNTVALNSLTTAISIKICEIFDDDDTSHEVLEIFIEALKRSYQTTINGEDEEE